MDPNITLIDDATAHEPLLGPEIDGVRAIAVDPSRPLVNRLEAYEDIIDSEVGDTSLTRARNLERITGLRQLYLKFEGGNPTGTQKDRIAFAQALDAMRRGYEGVALATCGNYGAAAALAAELAGLRCIIYIPERFQTKRLAEMTRQGVELVRVPGDYEAAVAFSREQAHARDLYDANPGGDNTSLQLSAYGAIALEIYDELRDAPAVVAVPTSNGTTLAGIYKGFVSLYRRGKTSRVPQIVAGSSFRKNPIINAVLRNTEGCDDLKRETIRETKVNEPLVNWHAEDGELALEAIRESNGWAGYVSDKKLVNHARIIREQEGLNVLPASTAGLAALIDRHAQEPLSGNRYVAVLTGRKS